MTFTVSIYAELTTDQRQCLEVCYAWHYIDFHWTHNRSMTLHGSLLCLSLYRFSPNSQQINDIAWKSAMSVAVSIFTELTTDQRYCMEVCYVCHCINFHWTHNTSMTLHGSLLCLSLYRFSPNSQQISYITWKSATPTSIHIVIKTYNKGHHSLDALHCTDVYFSTSLHADTLQVTAFKTANKKTMLSRFSRNSCLVNNFSK
jgi:hypothetical protein